jgi:hypothetical protein
MNSKIGVVIACVWGLGFGVMAQTFSTETAALAGLAAMERDWPERVLPIAIARARLVLGELLEPDLYVATFALKEVLRGTFTTNEVRVRCHPDTLHGTLPENAILLLETRSGEASSPIVDGTASAAGDEAGRGILPDTPANLERIMGVPIEELSKSPPEQMISRADAIVAANQALIERGEYADKMAYTTRRMNFGWFVGPYKLVKDAKEDERETDSWTVGNVCGIYVSDSGQVLKYLHF